MLFPRFLVRIFDAKFFPVLIGLPNPSTGKLTVESKEEETHTMPKKSDTTKGEKPKRAARAKKDPKAPKRNKSAYFFFCDDKRAETKEKYPELKITEISKKLAEQWKALNESDKKVFIL